MAILDYEHWSRETNVALPNWASSATGTVSADGQGPFGVGRHVSGAGTAFARYNSHANAAEVFVNSWVFFTGLSDAVIFTLFDASNAQVSLRITLTGTLRAVRGTSNTLGESTRTVAQNAWLFVQQRWLISATVGVVEIRVNGETWLSLTNQNTRATANNFINGWGVLGSGVRHAHLLVYSPTGDAPTTWTPETLVYADLPTGAGASSGFTPLSGANWAQADEQPSDGDTTYNAAAAAPTTDSYVAASSVPGGALVYAVGVEVVARKDDAGTNNLDCGVRTGGMDYLSGAAAALTTAYTRHRRFWTANPNTGLAWTPGEAGSAEIVVRRTA